MDLKLDFSALGVGQLASAVDKLDKANKQFSQLSDKIKDNKKSFDAFADFGFVRFFDSLNNSMIDIARTSIELQQVGGIMGLLSLKFAGFNAILGTLGASTLLGKIRLISLTLGSVLSPLIAIAAATYVLSRVWKENIGGIQTKWIEFMGRLKNTWARFDITVRKFLRQIGPLFNIVFSAIFEMLEGLFNGFIVTTKVFIGIFGPFLKLISNFISILNKDGQKSLGIWKAIGSVIGITIAALTGFFIIGKIITMVSMLYKGFLLVNAAIYANPIGAVVLGVVALIAAIVILQKKFDIFGKAVKLIVKAFKWIWDLVKKIFSFAIENSPLFKGINLVSKFAKKFSKTEKTNADITTQAATTVANANNVSNSNQDNRSASVVIHTQNMDTTKANNIGNAFINPVLDINKSL